MKPLLPILLATLLLLIFGIGCDLNKVTDDPLKMKAPTKVWVSVVPGLPLGPYRLGGWYKARYIDADPYDELKTSMIIWCTWLAAISGLAILGSFVMRYYRLPFATDVLVIAGIGFVGAFALALVVQYMAWIILGCVLGIGGYFGYVCYREYVHKKEKEAAEQTHKEDVQTHEELVTTGELLKSFIPERGSKERLAVTRVQSDRTIGIVESLEARAKAKAEEIRTAVFATAT